MRYTFILVCFGLLVSVYRFYWAPDILLFAGLVFGSVVALGIAGYWVDRAARKKVLAAIIVVILFLLLVEYASMRILFGSMALCEGYTGVLENVVTGDCRIMLIDCNPKPWYWTYSEHCALQFPVLLEENAQKYCEGRSDIESCMERYVANARS